MRVRSKLVCGILALSLTQSAFCLAIFALSATTVGFTTGGELANYKAQEMGLNDADVQAIQANQLTAHIRDLFENEDKSDEEILAILRETLEISE